MKRYLILADGSVFEGEAAGASGDVIGEVVFSTSMGGYMSTLTDPTYYGQIVTQTYPLIGNAGAITADLSEEDKPILKGYIAREICSDGSNFRKDGELNDYLVKNGVVALTDIDTRALTRKLREHGTTNGMITCSKADLDKKLALIKAYKITDAVKNTSTKEVVTLNAGGKYKVAVLDLGAKLSIERELFKRDCTVIRLPHNTPASDIAALKVDGIVITGGGGEPTENESLIKEVTKLNSYKIPTFAIGLGHEVLALSVGAKVAKLKHGHHGVNQPAKNLETGRVYMTSQNHGVSVVGKSLPQCAKVSYINVNDRTVEGVDYGCMPAFGVQFNPEFEGGPQDTQFLFDKFVDMFKVKQK